LIAFKNFILAVREGKVPAANIEDVKFFYQTGWIHFGVTAEKFPAMGRGTQLLSLVQSGAVKEVNEEVFRRAAEIELKSLQMKPRTNWGGMLFLRSILVPGVDKILQFPRPAEPYITIFAILESASP